MFTTAIAKAHQLAWEAWKFTWRNLRTGILFVALPCLITALCTHYLNIDQRNNPIMYLGLTDLLFPLWVGGWIRYILSQKPLSIRTYFVIDKTSISLLFYAFAVGAPLYFYEYLNHLVGFNPLHKIVELKIGVPLQMDQTILKYYGVGLITLMFLSFILLPFYFVFPTLVDKKPFQLLKSWERVKPFYLSFCLSYSMLIFTFSIFAIFILMFSQFSIWYLVSMGNIYHLEFITNWPIWAFLANREILTVIWQYFVSLFFYTLITLYYKKFLTVKNKSKPKKNILTNEASSATTL